MTKEAWVTVVTNDTYGLGALVLGSSLRRVATTRDTVVLVTPGVSDRMREELGRLFTSVVPVDVLDSGDSANLALMSRPELGVTFTKLHAWTLVQYSKCVFLDADTLVIQNCDELFEREELSAVPDPGWPDCFNSGVFVFVPSLVTYQALLDFAVAHGSFDGGDQGLLNMFFREWATQDIKKHLSFIYNLVASTAYTYLPALKFFGSQVKIVHFLGGNKPWTKQAEASSLPYQRAWWSIFREDVSPRLTQDMIMSSSLTGSASQAGPTTPRHRFQDPWLNFKPQPDSHLSLPDPPGRNVSLESRGELPQSLCHANVCHNHQNIKQTENTEQNKDLIKPTESHNSSINEENHDCFRKINTESNHFVNNNTSNLLLNTTKFKAPSHLKSDNPVNGFKIHIENLRSENSSEQFSENDMNLKLTEQSNSISSSISKSNTFFLNNYESNIEKPLLIEETTKEYQILFLQDTENNQIQNPQSEKDLTMNELDKTEIILKPTKPCFLQNESGSSKGDFNFTGVAGALARGDSEEWRREAWEAGDVDYLGRDSFDNIWRRICECVGIASISPVQPAAVIPPAGEKPVEPAVKPAEQTEVAAQPAQPAEPTTVVESSTPKDVTAQPAEAPAKEASVIPIVAAEVSSTAVAATEVSAAPVIAADTPALPAAQTETAAQSAVPAEAPVQPTPPADKPIEPATPAEKTVVPTETPVQPAAPVETPAQPTTPAEAQIQPDAPVLAPAQPTVQAEAPSQPAAPTEIPAQNATPVETPAQQPTAPAESPAQPAAPAESPAQPDAPAEKPVEQAAAVPAAKVETQSEAPKDAVPQPLPTEAASQPPAPAEVSPQPPVSTEVTPQPPTPTEAIPQPPVPAETPPQPPVSTEEASQPPAPVEASPQPTKTSETSTAPGVVAPAESTPKTESVGKASAESKPAETPVDSDVKASEPQPAPTECPIKSPETDPAAQAALPSDSTIPPAAPVPADVTPQTKSLPQEKPATEPVPAAETKTKSEEAPKCSAKPEDCCGKPEACSVKPPTSTEQGKDSVCSKPEKKPKETPKLPPTPPDAPTPGAAPTSSSEGAACPKEPGTPTVTPPSGAASPIAADTPEVCKLQATPSQPSTPPASGPEGSEPPVPPKRKQAKAPKGGKK